MKSLKNNFMHCEGENCCLKEDCYRYAVNDFKNDMFFSFFYDPYQNSCAMHIPLKATYSTEGAYND